jgi:hypothetical protein
MHTAAPLIAYSSPFEVKIATTKLKRDRPPGGDRIPAELIQAGCETVLISINSLILFGIRKNFLSVEGVYYCTNLQEG